MSSRKPTGTTNFPNTLSHIGVPGCNKAGESDYTLGCSRAGEFRERRGY
ncbi:hypothetical protein NG798_26255 [Ancylothrix sp. C2]|nr:hypothetical protein [Ancylothrix sp. D3o]MCT7953306.1 hypothetical protein [Ancylothrix sp. D3o]